MQKPILFNTIKYLDNIIQIIDSKESEKSKNFMDTSLILYPAIACYDPIKEKYLGYNPKLINDLLHYFYHTSNYEILKKEIKKHKEFFKKNMTDLISIDFMITPTINLELTKTKTYKKNKVKYEKKKLRHIESTKKFYTKKYQKNGLHKAQYVPIYRNAEFSKEKNIYNYINELLVIEHKLASEVKEDAKRYLNNLIDIKIKNYSIYQMIYSEVYKAFNEYKQSLQCIKDQNNSKDHKILSEVILYSHIFGEEINLFTADSDFYRISKFLERKRIHANIHPEVNIVQKMMQKDPKETPYFKKMSKITYNNGFIVER